MFKIGQEVKANNSHYQIHGITCGNVYKVLGVCGSEIQVEKDLGATRWVAAKFFNALKVAGCNKMKHDHVSVGKWIISSLHPTQGFSAVAMPQTQNTAEAARKECERLAGLDKTRKFVYLKIEGACQAIGVEWE